MNTTTRLLCFALALSLAACSTTSGLSATESRSGFSGRRIVSIPVHGLACNAGCLGLGAQWTEPNKFAALEVAILMVYAPIQAAELSIDGQVVKLDGPGSITQFSLPGEPVRKSTRAFAVDFPTVRQILASKRTWLRVQTPGGWIEDSIISDGKDSKAFNALARFVAQAGPAAQ